VLDSARWLLDVAAWLLYSTRWLLYSTRWLLHSATWLLDSARWLLNSGIWLLDSARWLLDSKKLLLLSTRWHHYKTSFKNRKTLNICIKQCIKQSSNTYLIIFWNFSIMCLTWKKPCPEEPHLPYVKFLCDRQNGFWENLVFGFSEKLLKWI
jgi:hypothetical protein